MKDRRLRDPEFNPPLACSPWTDDNGLPTPANHTLFDVYAAAAMSGLLGYHNPERGDAHTNGTFRDSAACCARFAIALLEERAECMGISQGGDP